MTNKQYNHLHIQAHIGISMAFDFASDYYHVRFNNFIPTGIKQGGYDTVNNFFEFTNEKDVKAYLDLKKIENDFIRTHKLVAKPNRFRYTGLPPDYY